MDERREDLVEGEGERDALFAALGESDLLDACWSRPGVDARELALLNGSDLARILFRLRAVHCQALFAQHVGKTYIDLVD